MSGTTPVEARQMREWFASIQADDVVLSGDVVVAVLGISSSQIKRRLKSGDLVDLNYDGRVCDAVKTLARQARNAIGQHVFRTGQHVNSPKVG
jgi:hypothetical protein